MSSTGYPNSSAILRASAASASASRRARNHRHLGADRQLARGGLAAHRGDRFRRRTDERQSRIAHGASEPLALGEKAVPGVNGLGARAVRGFDDLVAAQVALARGRRSDVHRLVRLANVRRARVGVAVDGHGSDSHLTTRANDAQRDLAAVGNENLGKAHSGMLPCFFGGLRSRLARSVSSAPMSRGRVSRGSMMSST